jgi:hypothetical protein
VGRPAVILSAAGRRDRPSPGRTLGEAVSRTRFVVLALLSFALVVALGVFGVGGEAGLLFAAGFLAGAMVALATVED